MDFKIEGNDLNELFHLVWVWSHNKGFLDNNNVPKQFMKCQEELGEGCSAYLKGKESELEDFLGDYFVTGIVLCHQLGKTPSDMLKIALNEIWNRKGKMVNGSFIKESDLSRK
jgi:hypothetical protein